MCKKCALHNEPDFGIGHFDSIHDVEEPHLRHQVIKLLGPRPFPEWPEAAGPAPAVLNGPASSTALGGGGKMERSGTAETVTIRTKRHSPVDKRFAFESPDRFGGSRNLLSAADLGELGGIRHFTETNTKILELVSHNNLLLTERLKVGAHTYMMLTRKFYEKTTL
jgi:hypothetical protein